MKAYLKPIPLALTALVIGAGIFIWFNDIFKPKSKVISPNHLASQEETATARHENPDEPTKKMDREPFINENLRYLSNIADFRFSPEAQNLLSKNGFVVIPDYHEEFFPIYEQNRYNYTPNFVTTDSLFHNYHLMFDYLLRRLEEEKLASALKKLNAGMLAEAVAQHKALLGTEWENAAKRNIGFFVTGSKLLDSTVSIPRVVKNEVERELDLIEAHRGVDSSPVMNIGGGQDTVIDTPQGPQPLETLKEDYSQYVPRGHYDKTEQLKAYFKSMMWYGRLTFRFKSEDEIKSAALITLALNKESNRSSWEKVFEPMNFFVGKSDDITYYQFKDLAEQVYGANTTVQALVSEQDKFSSFAALARRLEPPQINSIPVFWSAIQPDREKEIKGFRFMGQRFTVDASIMQRLVERETPGRMLPKGLDIPAAMGSKEALNILTELGETKKYPAYLDNMAKVKSYIAGLPIQNWRENLYWGWFYSLRPFLEEKPNGYPAFMRNFAWVRKELNTFLGSWTELKHDTILYAKQVYAELGGGGPNIEKKDDRGYVEPNPQVYARLASLLKITKEGLEKRTLLSADMKDNLGKMEQLALFLETIAKKELNNEKLTDDQYELIRSYGGQLEHFWLKVNGEEMVKQQLDQRNYLSQNPAALVADVATDPNGTVLEEATGRISLIYAIVSVDGKLKIAKGGVYSYYEFEWPMSDRLTDQKWREMLDSGQAPSLPSWTDAFTAKNNE